VQATQRRRNHVLEARIEKDFWPTGNEKASGVLVYDGINQIHAPVSKITTWGGKLIGEPCSVDRTRVLVYGLLRAVEAGLPVFLHVHDEISRA